jgi:hypothetical protein
MALSEATETRAETLAEKFVVFIETGAPPDGLFASDVFCDFTMPHWRLQAQDADGLVALRRQGHPGPGRVTRSRFDQTPDGFVLEFEERWEQGGQTWYAREMARADVAPDGITSLSIYCTGDWDEANQAEHRRAVTLIRE